MHHLPRRTRAAVIAAGFAAAIGLPTVASAAPLPIGTDPFTQATCAASSATNHHANVEPDSSRTARRSSRRTRSAGSRRRRLRDRVLDVDEQRRQLDERPAARHHEVRRRRHRTIEPRTPSVAYDARHNVWLISSLTLLEAGGVHGNAVVTSRSTDGGLTWGDPVTDGDRRRARQELDRLRQHRDQPVLRQLLHASGTTTAPATGCR